MRIEKLGIEHKDLLVPRLKALNASLSEYAFPNLYLFRKDHDYEVITDGEVFIRGKSYDGRRYLMPTSDVRSMDRSLLAEIAKEVDFLFPIPEEWLSVFAPGEFEVTFHEGDSDYLYTVEKMKTYAGRRLHKKRNLLKQFIESHHHEALPLTNDRLYHARSVLEEWRTESAESSAGADYEACHEALDRYDELVLCGRIIYADGEPAGFALGEELNPETFVLHFAKARKKFKGAYQYLYNSFAKVLPPKYWYLNLEQDLDKENMRVFKSSYVPHALLRKARVALRGRRP